MLETIVTWLTDTILALGYPGIVVLMALESSFFPFPSEVVLPPAGYLAAQGRMDAWLAIGSGILGSLIGAVINYALAAWLGLPLLRKYGKYVLVSNKSLDRSQAFFQRHGEISTLVGRLIPVIRQFISLPAGLARMRLAVFSAYTAAGAGIWCAVLTYIGWVVGKNSEIFLSSEVDRLTKNALLVILPVLLVVVAVYVYRHRKASVDSVRT